MTKQIKTTEEIDMNDTLTGLPTVEDQLEQCRRWADLLRAAGYYVMFSYTGERDVPAGYDKQWQVWTRGGNGRWIATIDIDGCGASWHGEDALWLAVIGSSEGVTARPTKTPEEHPMLIATVTTTSDGKLTDDSTCTINGQTIPVPTRVDGGGRLAPARIFAAVKALGYTTVDYYDTLRQYDGCVTIAVAASA
jgi:hypothetical protein